MTFGDENIYKLCLDAVLKNDIQHCTEMIHRVLGLPVMVESISHRLLAACPREIEDDHVWNSICRHDGAPEGLIMDLHEHDVFSAVMGKKSCVYVDWGIYGLGGLTPRVACNLLFGGKNYGTLILICPRGHACEGLFERVELFAKTAAVIVSKMSNVRNMHNITEPRKVLYSTFTRELFSGEFNPTNLSKWNDLLELDIKPVFRIIAVKPIMLNEGGMLHRIFDDLRELFPMHPIKQEDDFILMFSYYQPEGEAKAFQQRLLEFLEEKECIAGASCAFMDTVSIRSYIKQAEDALELSIRNEAWQKERLYKFQDHILEIVIGQVADKEYAKAICHPAIRQIIEYDISANTEYFETLKAYIENICISSAVSQKMHIHRNTLLYRINKIEEITGVRIDDPGIFMWLMCSLIAYRQADLQDDE